MKQLVFGDVGLITDNNNESWEDLMKVIKKMIEFDVGIKRLERKNKKRKRVKGK